jgi:hypothetical protein
MAKNTGNQMKYYHHEGVYNTSLDILGPVSIEFQSLVSFSSNSLGYYWASDRSSPGPDTILTIFWDNSFYAFQDIVAVTWNDVAVTEIVQGNRTVSNKVAAAIYYIGDGAIPTSNLVVQLEAVSGTMRASISTLTNLLSGTPLDTDSVGADTGTTSSFSGLANTDPNGVQVGAFISEDSEGDQTWTNATEVSDSAVAGIYRRSTAYNLGTPGGTISCASNTSDYHQGVAASFR